MENLSENIQTLFSYDTELSADSVEWCPHEPHQNVFVCANYQLEEKRDDHLESTVVHRTRKGRVLLFSITADNGLKLHETVNCPAVLDQKWCHERVNDSSHLGVVNANKEVTIFKLNVEGTSLETATTCNVDSDESETLVLSLDWSTGIYQSNEPEIICSDSKGNIHLLHLCGDSLQLIDTWNAHKFEAWIAAFYYWNTNIIFSGGDDSMFLKFDKRVGNQPVSRNRSHGAGVTSIHSNKSKEFIVATGSYDEYVRIWDTRNMKSEMSSIKMPGTLWRLKWDPFLQTHLLAACMLGGVHILNVQDIERMKIVGSYYEHKNIAYGADWCYSNKEFCDNFDGPGSSILGTCSFYDHLLCISKFDGIDVK
ncbi:unnamed protein product [Phaedon cochleariae]|uniref:methylated diphthine methylhydrolase n=1 Tax=Phaedon cochleariae TaxID=80249 RepID=A0A9P0GQP7_PHACE|nr:unnamed protein product [Phaedon cochleariae]